MLYSVDKLIVFKLQFILDLYFKFSYIFPALPIIKILNKNRWSKVAGLEPPSSILICSNKIIGPKSSLILKVSSQSGCSPRPQPMLNNIPRIAQRSRTEYCHLFVAPALFSISKTLNFSHFGVWVSFSAAASFR